MLGAMGNTDHDESVRMIHTALDAGINFVDTADVYSAGRVRGDRGPGAQGPPRRRGAGHQVRAARWGATPTSAAARPVGSPGPSSDSLRRLGTDHIDLYQMHRPDHDTDIDETLAALSDLIRSGKVRAIGSSTFPAELIVEAQWAADRRGHHRFRTEQPRYSILNRTIEGAVLPDRPALRDGRPHLRAAEQRLAVGTGRPDQGPPGRGAGGQELRPHRARPTGPSWRPSSSSPSWPPRPGCPLTHLATAFVRAHPAVTSVIIGPRTPDQLDDLLAGADVELDGDVLDRIDEIVPPGTELNPADNYFATSPAIEDKRLRRR